MYRVETASRRVEKEIANRPSGVKKHVIQVIRDLVEDPRPQGTRKLMGAMRGAWRIRVGDCRIIYDVDDAEQLVIVLAVLHRREVYRR